MRAHEILIEVAKTERFKHGKYLLVHTIEPDKNNMYVGQIYDPNNTTLSRISNQNIDALKAEFINITVNDQKTKLKKDVKQREKVSASDVRKAALNLNTAFTLRVFENQVPTAIRLGTDGGKLIVDVMIREYFEMDGATVDKSFRKVNDRMWSKQSRTKIYGVSNVDPVKLEQMGFEFHGVYDLTDEKSPDPNEFRRYSLDLIAYSDREKSYSFPAITIAFWYKGSKVQSGDEQ